MNIKVVIGSLAALIVIIIGILFLIPGAEYSDEPKDWIDKTKEGIEIDVVDATKGTGYVDEIGQQMRDGETITVFDWEGFYQGKHFLNEYKDSQGNILMRISPDMDSNDGIIEGFVMERKENGKFMIYVFLDEDWKNALPETNMFWGSELQKEKKFEFDELRNGIYMSVVEDDPSRFAEDMKIHLGGIIVGDITKEDTEDKTLIRFI